MHQIVIQDGAHKYVCETPDKGVALQFMTWFLDGVSGEAAIIINYRQAPPKEVAHNVSK